LTKVRLTGDVELRINGSSFEDVRTSFKTALATNSPWEINGADGQVVVVNPHHVLFLEPLPNGTSGEARVPTLESEPAGIR
jgi:hypothetical protein